MMLPVTVIAGYLGAGKTTLLNHLLRHANGRKLAILVNEFGDLAIDESLIESETDKVKSLAGGCICCAFGGDLVSALEDIRDETDCDHILIEASGVAYPASIMSTIYLMDGLMPESTLVLADGEQIQQSFSNHYVTDVIHTQLMQADLIFVTKTDLLETDQLDELISWLKEIVLTKPVIPLRHEQMPFEMIIGLVSVAGRFDAPPSHHFTNFTARQIVTDDVIKASELAENLANDQMVVRAKGFVQTTDGIKLIHVVGPRYDITPAPPSSPLGVICIEITQG